MMIRVRNGKCSALLRGSESNGFTPVFFGLRYGLAFFEVLFSFLCVDNRGQLDRAWHPSAHGPLA